ncbi:DNA repair protein XRCC3 isoform X6 [Macaca mulatta]
MPAQVPHSCQARSPQSQRHREGSTAFLLGAPPPGQFPGVNVRFPHCLKLHVNTEWQHFSLVAPWSAPARLTSHTGRDPRPWTHRLRQPPPHRPDLPAAVWLGTSPLPPSGAVYICTEDAFPHKRLQQLMAQQPRLRTDVPGELLQKLRFGSQIFIEHVADVDALLECVNKKVPVLLSRGMARLVVIDSVAAPFRCEFDSQASAPRARRLQSLGAALRELSSAFQSPVLCINQVTEAMEEQGAAHGPLGFWDERVSPALGITWANQLLVRLLAERLREEEAALGCPARTLRVLFAPHLPPSSCSYTISAEGVRGTPGTQSH